MIYCSKVHPERKSNYLGNAYKKTLFKPNFSKFRDIKVLFICNHFEKFETTKMYISQDIINFWTQNPYILCEYMDL